MPLIYITGPPGVGKSAIENELRSQGYEAYDIDDSTFGGAYNKQTGKRVSIPPADQRKPDWFDNHEWRTDIAALKKLKEKAKDTPIYVCGVTPDDTPILPVFDKVMYLHVDDEILKDRIKNRQGNDYGNNDNELADIMKRKQKLDENYANSTVTVLDATNDIDAIVRQILSTG